MPVTPGVLSGAELADQLGASARGVAETCTGLGGPGYVTGWPFWVVWD
jgi:hypothetical protein